jgi:hypothetical protein
MQPRPPKYERAPESFKRRQITTEALSLVRAIHHYPMISSPLLQEIVGGDRSTRYRQLQTLYHQGIVSRFPFPPTSNQATFHYYLDNPAALELLGEHNLLPQETIEHYKKRIGRNKNKAYDQIKKQGTELVSKLLTLTHETDISRFHAQLELACRNSQGRGEDEAELALFAQGAELWEEVRGINKTRKRIDDQGRAYFETLEEVEKLPLRPDAFFILHFPNRPEWCKYSYFFYERDRKTTTDTNRINRKWRSYWWAITVEKRYRERGIKQVRGVIVETTTKAWAETLRRAAKQGSISPRPSPLFWFSSSDELRQETMFDSIFKTPYNDEQTYSLLDR